MVTFAKFLLPSHSLQIWNYVQRSWTFYTMRKMQIRNLKCHSCQIARGLLCFTIRWGRDIHSKKVQFLALNLLDLSSRSEIVIVVVIAKKGDETMPRLRLLLLTKNCQRSTGEKLRDTWKQRYSVLQIMFHPFYT